MQPSAPEVNTWPVWFTRGNVWIREEVLERGEGEEWRQGEEEMGGGREARRR